MLSPGQYDTAKEIVSMAVVKEIITRKGAWYYYKDEKWQGLEAALADIREDIGLHDELVSLIASTPDGPKEVVS